jgi:molecular chaperone DnaJ
MFVMGQGMSEEDVMNMFRSFWGGSGSNQGMGGMGEEGFSFFDMFDQGSGTKNMRGADINLILEISFMESINGVMKELKINKRGKCQTCSGSGCKPGTSTTRCNSCGGKGKNTFRQGPIVFETSCNTCKGSGNMIKNPCTSCRGSGIGNISSVEKVTIPKGISHGQNIRMTGKVDKNRGFLMIF